ncbi:hypothetical protein V565_094670 [Rhizoctonia solani 123E]|uniref:Uncharacterized protein n=1 Tax=Rhizoctonia solani 123E TaxID=1423351 RepID=A0A074SI96_9AGAM|nr:hypothetical protein V565_094670 [Rhizoctonia solani 123E]
MFQPEAAEATQTDTPPASLAGSSTASWSNTYSVWIEYVRWDGGFYELHNAAYDRRPEAKKLRELVMKSFTVPEWLADIESPEWASYYKYMRRLRGNASGLSRVVSTDRYNKVQGNEDLSLDVHESLPFILHIGSHTNVLKARHSEFEPMEADRRHSVDTLGTLVWDLQSNGLVIYCAERKLAIPYPREQTKQAKGGRPGEVQPDACAFIPMPDIPLIPQDQRAALSCFPMIESTHPDYKYALHWVTEFKRDNDHHASKCQVVEGLVSALYQRRAFGCPNHFIFGTAHYSRTLEVLAATWVPSDEPTNPGASPQEADTKMAAPPQIPANDPLGNSLGNTTSGAPKNSAGEEVADVNTKLTIEQIKKHNKIVVYSIGTYDMREPEDILQLYLLMRQTRALAQQYKNEIMQSTDRVWELFTEIKDIYRWPPPPRPKSDRGSKKRKLDDGRGGQLPHMPENTSMSIEPYENSDDSGSQSDLEELESLGNAGSMQRIVGEVASYTLMNYAHNEDAGACVSGSP